MNKRQNDYILKQNLFRLLDPALLVIAVLPWLLLVAHQNWPLPGLNFDSLFSWGLYNVYDLKMPFATPLSSHYFSRLGAILPGYVVFHIFPAAWAVYILNFMYWYAAVFSIYFTLKLTVNKRAAFLTAVLMGCYPLILSSFSAGFNDGPATCYLSLTLLFLTLATRRDSWKIWLIAAGMSYAGALHSNFFLLNFVPFYAAYYFFLNHEARKNALLRSLLFMTLGIVTTTLIIGAINFYFGGQFFFFLPSVEAVINYSQRSPAKNPLYQPLYLTLAGSRHLVFPMLVFFGGIGIFLINRIKRFPLEGVFEYLFPLLYILNAGVYLFWELRGNVSPMGYPEYIGFLFPLMFLAIGAQFGYVSGLSRIFFRWLAGGVVIFFMALRVIVYNYTPYVHEFKLHFPAATSHNYSGIIIPIMACMVFLLILYAVKLKWHCIVFLVFIGITYVFLPDSLGTRLSREQFHAVDNSKKNIMNTPEYISQYRQRFWLDMSSDFVHVYKVVAGIFGGYYDFFKWPDTNFKEMEDTFKLKSIDLNGGRPAENEVILLLTEEINALPIANNYLSQIGLSATLLRTERIEQGPLKYHMDFLTIKKNIVNKNQ